jgi:hypothetical protein
VICARSIAETWASHILLYFFLPPHNIIDSKIRQMSTSFITNTGRLQCRYWHCPQHPLYQGSTVHGQCLNLQENSWHIMIITLDALREQRIKQRNQPSKQKLYIRHTFVTTENNHYMAKNGPCRPFLVQKYVHRSLFLFPSGIGMTHQHPLPEYKHPQSDQGAVLSSGVCLM